MASFGINSLDFWGVRPGGSRLRGKLTTFGFTFPKEETSISTPSFVWKGEAERERVFFGDEWWVIVRVGREWPSFGGWNHLNWGEIYWGEIHGGPGWSFLGGMVESTMERRPRPIWSSTSKKRGRSLEFGKWMQERLLRNTEAYLLRGFCCIIIPPKQGEATLAMTNQAEAGKSLEKELPLFKYWDFGVKNLDCHYPLILGDCGTLKSLSLA